MKITLEQDESTISIEANHVTSQSVLSDMIIPIMIASGFHKDSIFDALESVLEEFEDEKDSSFK